MRVKKTLGAIIPHLKTKNGGLRRFVEIGNEFARRGYDFTLYVQEFKKHEWPIHCRIGDFDNIDADLVLIGDPPTFHILDTVKGQPWIYVIAGGEYIPQYHEVYKKYPFIVNNRVFERWFPDAHVIEGGVSDFWQARKKLRVGYHASKGKYVEQQLNGFEHINLIPLIGYSDDELREHYSSLDYFASWEVRPGWANMAAEALSCGIPVVTNGVNCEPFLNRCIVVNNNLQEYFVDPMIEFTYAHIVDQLINLWKL